MPKSSGSSGLALAWELGRLMQQSLRMELNAEAFRWAHLFCQQCEFSCVVVLLPSCVWLLVTPCTAACQASLSLTISQFAQIHVHCIGHAIWPSHPLMPSSPSALNLSWHQGLFQRVICSHQIRSDQLLSRVRLFATPWIAACQASLSITNSWSSPRLTSIESVMPSSHLVLCRPLLLLPPIPPSIRVFSNESTLCMRWPKYWSFSFSISPGKWIFRVDLPWDWLGWSLCCQRTFRSLL